MAKVKVFVTDGQTDRQTEGRMRFNVPTLSRKYQSSICNSAKVMAKVNVFVTDGQTDRQTEGRMRFNVPTLSRKRGTKINWG